MFRKDFRELSLLKHVLLTAVLIPLIIALIAVPIVLTLAPGDTPTLVATLSFIVGIAFIFGIAFGVFLWLFNRGLHVIFGLGRGARAAYQRGKHEAEAAHMQDMIDSEQALAEFNEARANPAPPVHYGSTIPADAFPAPPIWNGVPDDATPAEPPIWDGEQATPHQYPPTDFQR